MPAFPHEDDIEGAAAKMSFFRTLLEGIIFQPRIMLWAATRTASHPGRHRSKSSRHSLLLIVCFALIPRTPIFAVYAVLMIMGSWVIPLVTSYLPHNPAGRTVLSQTRLFRGKIASVIAMEHLYHLEHHLYPRCRITTGQSWRDASTHSSPHRASRRLSWDFDR